MMNYESFSGHEPLSDNVEYRMIVGQLHNLFDEAVAEQSEAPGYRMFTVVGDESGLPDPLVRMRLMDARVAHEDLRSATKEATIDVGLPVQDYSVSRPRLRPETGYFVAYASNEDDQGETMIVVNEANAQQDLLRLHELIPHFMSRVITATPVSMRKNSR